VSRKKNLSIKSSDHTPRATLRISEVARRVGISSSALRAWEALGLVTPQRSKSRYRLYTEADVRLLQRALFLRRARGLNPPAIVHVLKRQRAVALPPEAANLPGQRFRRLRARRGLSLAQVARATGVSIGFLSSLERGQMRSSVATLRRIARFYRTNILSLFDAAGEIPAWCALRKEKFWRRMRASAWNYSLGAAPRWSRISSASSRAAAAANPTRTTAKNFSMFFAANSKFG